MLHKTAKEYFVLTVLAIRTIYELCEFSHLFSIRPTIPTFQLKTYGPLIGCGRREKVTLHDKFASKNSP